MQKHTLLSLAIIVTLLLSLTANATIRRVGFTGAVSPVNGIDYATSQAAHDAAVVGDTIQLYPSTQSSGATYSGNITKRLYIVGPGFFVNSYNLPSQAAIINNALQALPGAIASTNVTVGRGSARTIIAGISSLNVTTADILDSLNDIAIYRCRDVNVNFNNSGVCNNWIISQCYMAQVNQGGYAVGFSGNRSISNLRIENSVGIGINYSASTAQTPVGVNSGQILNCVWNVGAQGVTDSRRSLSFNNSVFIIQNCIDLGGVFQTAGWLFGASNCVFVNNITSASGGASPVASNPGCSGNAFSANTISNVYFLGIPNNNSAGQTIYSPDAAYQLVANSPARNFGVIPGTTTPTDCGIYGGTNPYKSSGIPNIPAFYRLNAASTTATGSTYTITYSVRSNN